MKYSHNIFLLFAAALFIVSILIAVSKFSAKAMSPQASAPTFAAPAVPAIIPKPKPVVRPIPVSSKIALDVPFVSEAPNNIWTGPWKNACEEASITMVDKFYTGRILSLAVDEQFMMMLFTNENKLYGSNANSDAARTLHLVDLYAKFSGTIKTAPTLDDIKGELIAGHPVIAFHRGFDLHNPHIPFLATGSSYHATVVVGFDDATHTFLVNDPGDEIDGINHRYGYDVFMNSLHDYNYTEQLADGPARVIFTSAKGK